MLEEVLEVLDREVADADGPRGAALVQLLHRLPRRDASLRDLSICHCPQRQRDRLGKGMHALPRRRTG